MLSSASVISGNSSSILRWTRAARNANASSMRSTCGSSHLSGSSTRREAIFGYLAANSAPIWRRKVSSRS